MSRFEQRQNKEKQELINPFPLEPVPILHRRKKKQIAKPQVADHITIAHRVLVEKEKYQDIGKEFSISIPRVSNIVKAVTQNESTWVEMQRKNESKAER